MWLHCLLFVIIQVEKLENVVKDQSNKIVKLSVELEQAKVELMMLRKPTKLSMNPPSLNPFTKKSEVRSQKSINLTRVHVQ